VRVLVTGGAGFIGSHLVDAYLGRGDKVLVVDDFSTGSEKNLEEALTRGLVIEKVSILDPKVQNLIKDFDPHLINHHAAQKSVRDSVENPIRDLKTNVEGLLNILGVAKSLADLKRIIFASSGGVMFGDEAPLPTPESYPETPSSPYGISKLASEHYLRFFAPSLNLKAVALRYANVYGPRQDPLGEAGVVAIFSEKMLKGEATRVFGDGNQTRDFVYVADIVEANLRAETIEDSFSVFHIGSGLQTSVNELHREMSEIEGMSGIAGYQLKPEYAESRVGEQMRSCLDASSFAKRTAWAARTDIQVGLKLTIDYFRSK